MGRDALVVAAPLRIEAWALRRGIRRAPGGAGRTVSVVVTGMGSRRSLASALRLPDVVVIAGFGGALSEGLEPGELVVASEVVGPEGDVEPCAGASELTDALRRAGLVARAARIASSHGLVRGAARERLAATGAAAVDQESFWLVQGCRGRAAVVRAIVDTPRRELMRPLATLAGGVRAYRSLARAASVIATWHSPGRPRGASLIGT